MPTYQGLLASPDASAIVELIKSLRELRTATSPPGTAPPPPAGPLPVAPIATPREEP
jgi:hypothetical protein